MRVEILQEFKFIQKSKSMNLAFDITPAKYITALITEKGICEASSAGLKNYLISKMSDNLKQQIIDFSLKLNSTNLSPLRSGNISYKSEIE